MTFKHTLPLLPFLVLPFFCLGCGGPPRPADLPPLHPCTVTLKQEGTPVAGAMVTLTSTDPSFRWSVAGITNESGVVVFKTHAQFPGVPLGDYKMIISKTERFQSKEPEEVTVGDVKMISQGSPIILYTLVDKQYANVETTPLTITVKKGKNNESFDLGKAVREELERVRL